MKTPTLAGSLGLLTLVACLLFVPGVHAGLTFNVDVYRSIHGTFYNFYTPISTNTTPPDAPVGMYFINSPQWPASGSTRQYQITTNGLNTTPVSGQETGYSDYASMMEQITNGTWTILYTNCTTTNLYTFTVSAPDMTSNMMPATTITYPANGALNIPNQPTLTWTGPTNFPLNDPYTYVANYDFSFYQSANIPSTQTNWTLSIPDGINCNFAIDYLTNYASLFVATTPLSTNGSEPIAGWISTSTVESGDSVSFAVTNPPATGITLVAHYTFANSGNLGQDSSGNGYDLDFNGGDGVTSSSTAIAGGGAAYFDGGSFFSYMSTPSNVLSTLAGDFSLSFWIETTQNDGNENGEAWAGAGIMAADVPGSYYDIVPAALDGGEIGFNTGPNDDTLNSQTDINDGNYHHVVITRDQATGEKQIYIDGVLNNTDFATMNPLSDPHILAIGSQIDASQTDPASANTFDYFHGLLDDMQLYSGVLSSNQVSALFASPGSTVAGSNSGSGGGHTLVAHYTFAVNSGLYQADSSGNNNNINGGGYWAPNPNWGFTTNAIAGGGALTFDGGEDLGFGPGQGGQAFDSWLACFYGSFSISLWINTTNVLGNDSDNLTGYNDADILYAYNDGINDTIPIALTGHKVAFFTGDPTGANGDTLHSTACVTSGNWVHIVVTRDGATGQKTIYINGVLDNSDTGVTNNLDGDTNNINIGAGGPGYSYAGALDDLQIYSGVLTASNVACLYNNPGMFLSNVPGPTNNPIAFYDFDESTPYAADLTANGYNIINGGNFGGPALTSDSVSGSGAAYFNGGSFLTPSSNLLSTLAGNFSLSLWVKTTQNLAWTTAPASYGAGVFCADIPGQANDIIPIALTGGAVAFNTGGAVDDTLNSVATVNDGNYHHIVVTRNEATGAKQIYVDDVLSASDIAYTGLLNAPQLITIGALADASNPDPTSPSYTGYNGFVGTIDDIQMYSCVISSNDVAFLDSNPGQTINSNLVAHYDFDEGTVLAADVSGNGNNMVYAGSCPGPGPGMSLDAASGPSALSFDGGSYLVPNNQGPNNLVTNFAGTFSLSVWLETTQSLGSAGEPADEGAGVVTAGIPSQSDDIIPIALTGGNVAFETDGNVNDVLTSETAINDGNYHHIVVTRDQNSGIKQIYIDGVLNTSDVADTALLNNPQIVVLGCQADASQNNPNSPTSNGYNGYAGLMDQLQVYSRVLSPDEVSYLYNNPGATLVGENNSGGSSPPANTNYFGDALGQPGLTWTTGGNANWFVETTNTFSTNTAAAQSGSISGDDISVLSTTITGACEVSFEWQTMAGSDDSFNLQFLIDGNYQRQITGTWPWTPESFYTTPGVHTLDWEATAAASPSDAGFLDQVVITPSVVPVITVNPFSQTNYPGYDVALLAAATGTPTPTWQWYQEGNPSPLPYATNALYIPPNSGQSSVAGTYYAIASNNAGSAMTTPATVTFVNGLAPSGWTNAFVSPLENYNLDGVYTLSTNVYYSCVVDSTGTNEFSSGYAIGTNYYYNAENQVTTIYGQDAAIIIAQNLSATHPVQWVVTVTNNGNGNAYAEGLALAPNGGVYAAGHFTGTNWLGSTLLQDSGAGTTFLARLDANGNLIWITTVTNSFPVTIGVVSDASGNVTLTAIANSSTTIGGSNYLSSGQSSFVAQFNSAGTLNWVEHSSNPIEYLAGGYGRIYASLINYFGTNDSIAGISNNSACNWSFAAINATNGSGIWVQGVGEAAGNFPYDGLSDDIPEIAVSSNYVFLVGTAYGSSAVFGPYSVGIANGRGQYFARFDTSGNAQLATGFGGTNAQPWAAVASPSGNVYVTGAFDTYTYFGNFILAGPHLATFNSAYAFSQAFLAKFNTNGVPQWALQAISEFGGDVPSDFINLFDVSLGGENVWVAGVGSGPVEFGENLPTSNEINLNEGLATHSLPSGMLGLVTDNPPYSVTLIGAQRANPGFQFSFVSDAGHTNYVQYTTNLLTEVWESYSNILGDGTLKTIVVPSTNHPTEFFRVETQ